MNTKPKRYSIKKIFGPTLQGEGSLTGVQTLFVRFAGCNMWDGRPETRAESACPYCDTDFFGGTKMTAREILEEVKSLARPMECNWITLSGGEPALQLDRALCVLLRDVGNYSLAIETNGTRNISDLPLDHVSMSPKVPPDQLKQLRCDDLKLLYPHPNPAMTPEAFAHSRVVATRRYLQPINHDDTLNLVNVAKAHAKAQELGASWRVSVQMHKAIGVE